MSTRHHLARAVLAAASLAACRDDAPATAPEAALPVSVASATTQASDTAKTAGTSTTGGGRGDTTATGATGGGTARPPADTTTAQNFPASVRVQGRLLMKSYEPSSTSADSLSGFEPVAGQRITLFRNRLVDGKGVSDRIGEATTGADGSYQFQNVPGGYYVLALNVTAQRPWGSNVAYAIGNKAEIEVTTRFWRMPDGPSGGGTTPPDSSR
ncbi:MAG: hypothetical protein ACXW0Z_04920 [Gemmatirosa sp.]